MGRLQGGLGAKGRAAGAITLFHIGVAVVVESGSGTGVDVSVQKAI